jgi:chromosome segregation ATPase
MGHSLHLAEITSLQISSFLAYIFPFLASVAFTLFLRWMDRKNSLMHQIKIQRDELYYTSQEVEGLKKEIKSLIKEMETAVQEKADELYDRLQVDSHDFQARLEKQSQENTEKLQRWSEDNRNRFDKDLEELAGRFKAFESRMEEKQKEISNVQTSVQEIARNTNQKMLEFEAHLIEKSDIAAQTVEERLSNYSKKFQDRLELIFDQANHSISTISKDMRQEVRVLREEVADIHNHYQEREAEFFKDYNARKAKLFEEFSQFVENSQKSLDGKFSKYKEEADEIERVLDRVDYKMEDKFESSTNVLIDKISFLEKKVTDRYEILQKEANTQKDLWFKSFWDDVNTIKAETRDLKDNFDVRKDGLMSNLKKETDALQGNIDQIKNQYLESENKLLKDFETKKHEIERVLYDSGIRIKNLEEDILEKIKAVDQHFADLKEAVNESARDTLDQVEHRVMSIESKLDDEIRDKKKYLDTHSKEWNLELDKLKTKQFKQSEEIENRLSKINLEGKDLLESFKEEFIAGRSNLDHLYQSYSERLTERTDLIVLDVQNRIKNSQDEVDSMLARLQKSGLNLYEKQETLLAEFGEKLHRDLQGKLEKLKFESEELLEYIQKAGNNLLEKQEEKIDKFNSTLDERISKQLTILIDKGQLQLDALEARISAYVQEVKVNIENSLKNAREDSDRQISNFNGQVLKTFKEIETANNEFLDSARKDFSRTKEDFLKVKGSVELELSRVNELKNGIYTFLAEESSKLQSQKFKSEQINENIVSAFKSMEDLNRRTEELKEKIMLLTSIDDKIQYLQEVHSEFEVKVDQLAEVNVRINELIKNLETSERSGADVTGRISQILSEVNILQQKENELEENLENIDKRTAILQSRQQDIKSLESKFEKVEGLMMDLSTRHKQISTLQNRLESLKDKTETMKDTLEKLLEEADDKFEKLSDFLTVVDSVSANGSKGKGTTKDSDVMKKKRATVIQLHENFDWPADTIAEKLNMEQSLVEAIINNKR